MIVLMDNTLWKLTKKAGIIIIVNTYNIMIPFTLLLLLGDALKPVLHKLCVSIVAHLIDNNLFISLHVRSILVLLQ